MLCAARIRAIRIYKKKNPWVPFDKDYTRLTHFNPSQMKQELWIALLQVFNSEKWNCGKLYQNRTKETETHPQVAFTHVGLVALPQPGSHCKISLIFPLLIYYILLLLCIITSINITYLGKSNEGPYGIYQVLHLYPYAQSNKATHWFNCQEGRLTQMGQLGNASQMGQAGKMSP